MKKKDQTEICQTVDSEGFDYTFRHYSNFPQIKDKKFHELREKYSDIANELETYIGWDEFSQ